jgi:hypothetical protein
MEPVTPRCERCGRAARFRFAGAGRGAAFRCWRHGIFYGPVLQRSLGIAAVVGTVLFIINQLDVVLSGNVTSLVVLKIALAFVVPFVVSTYLALEINRLRAVRPPQKEPTDATPDL